MMIGSRQNRIWVAFTLTALLQVAFAGCTGSRGASAQSEGHQSMKPPDAIITASIMGDDIAVTVILINHGPAPFPLLRWNLPPDGHLTGSLFEVDRNGERQEYVGEMV